LNTYFFRLDMLGTFGKTLRLSLLVCEDDARVQSFGRLWRRDRVLVPQALIEVC
jgi:hypothetical protein